MIRYAGAGDATEVHTQVEAFGIIRFAQRLLASLNQIHHLIGRFFWRCAQLADVCIGRNHQVTADVWVSIEKDEVMSAAVNDQIPFVVRWILLRGAEDATGRRFFRTAGCDVVVPPGTPQYFHRQTLRSTGWIP